VVIYACYARRLGGHEPSNAASEPKPRSQSALVADILDRKKPSDKNQRAFAQIGPCVPICQTRCFP